MVDCLPSKHKAVSSTSSTGKKKKKTRILCNCVPVAYARNPSYSQGRDQEDHGSKSAWVNHLQDPISKRIHHKNRAGGVAQGVGTDFKPQYCKKQKR
jgi:hypothetical protein